MNPETVAQLRSRGSGYNLTLPDEESEAGLGELIDTGIAGTRSWLGGSSFHPYGVGESMLERSFPGVRFASPGLFSVPP